MPIYCEPPSYENGTYNLEESKMLPESGFTGQAIKLQDQIRSPDEAPGRTELAEKKLVRKFYCKNLQEIPTLTILT